MSKAAKPAKKNDAAPAALGGFGDLEKVRDILFGAQSEELAARILNLEAHVEDEFGSLRATVDKRFATLEALLKKQYKALGDRLTSEQRDRNAGEERLAQSTEAVSQALQANRTELDDVIRKTEAGIRRHIDRQIGSESQDRSERFEQLTARMEEAIEELKDAKTNRADLADLLAEVSNRLREA